MKEINWQEVARLYGLTVEQLENQVMIAASVMGDINIGDSSDKGFQFTCEHQDYKTVLTLTRAKY